MTSSVCWSALLNGGVIPVSKSRWTPIVSALSAITSGASAMALFLSPGVSRASNPSKSSIFSSSLSSLTTSSVSSSSGFASSRSSSSRGPPSSKSSSSSNNFSASSSSSRSPSSFNSSSFNPSSCNSSSSSFPSSNLSSCNRSSLSMSSRSSLGNSSSIASTFSSIDISKGIPSSVALSFISSKEKGWRTSSLGGSCLGALTSTPFFKAISNSSNANGFSSGS